MFVIKTKLGQYLTRRKNYGPLKEARIFRRIGDAKLALNSLQMKICDGKLYKIAGVELAVVPIKIDEIKERQRPSWTDYFLGLAMTIKERSHDSQTQVGCVITDDQHRILGTGYNGFPKGMPDDKLPTTRPDKYPWMRHAERNALDNCIIRPENGVAYQTCIACFRCLTDLHQAGIKKVYYIEYGTAKCIDEQDKLLKEVFRKYGCKVELIPIKPNLDWLVNVN